MNKSHSTSKDGTGTPTADQRRLIPSQRRRKPGLADVFVSIIDDRGNSFTDIFTPADEPTDTSTSECEIILMFSGDSRKHPVGIHCTVHNWDGDITDGGNG